MIKIKFGKKANFLREKFSCFSFGKKGIASFQLIILIVSMFAFSYFLYLSTGDTNIVSAKSSLSEPSVCCEKTVDGAFCINTNSSKCDSAFKSSPTSCQSTSYCKLGTCYDSKEGICMENTPQNVCQENGGTWDEREMEDVPQCQLGCCIIADQAAFVSLTRCKRLSTLFGVENNFNSGITDEITCIAEAQSQDVGACVYESDYERICEFTTRSECGAGNVVEEINGTNITLTSEKRFYKNYLCSAEELSTVCARQTSTSCYQGDVYWFDSCGNRENVYYGGSEENLLKSWNNGRVADAEEICSAEDNNKECGNCDYLLGSRCAEWDSVLGIGKPSDSDYYCQKTTCKDRYGNTRKNGESWCVSDGVKGNGQDPAGSLYYREICVDGDVRVEPCADYRNEICIESSLNVGGGFQSAACRVNRWQDCVAQTDNADCVNIDKRDCVWLGAVTGMLIGEGSTGDAFSNPASGEVFSNPTTNSSVVTGNAIFGFGSDDEETDNETTTTNRPFGVCVPAYSPGFDFWEDGDAQGICSQASAKCVVKYEKSLLGEKECVENCECLEEQWAVEANRVCYALGDCGGYVNFEGVYTGDGYEWSVGNETKKFASFGSVGTGSVIAGVTAYVVGLITGKVDNPLTFLTPETQEEADAINKIISGSSKNAKDAINTVKGGSAIKNIGGEIDWTDVGSSSAGKVGTGGLSDAQIDAMWKEAATSDTPLPTAPGSAGYQSWIAKKIGLAQGGMTSAIVGGLQWALTGYFVGKLVGGLFGLSDNNKNALGLSLASGAFVWKTIQGSTYLTEHLGWVGGHPFITGLGVSVVVFLMLYKTESTEIVTFTCQPWQAPVGGNSCEQCNDKTLPCTEYRCKSLGQNCGIVNEGTDNIQCVNLRPDDVSPPVITPDSSVLTFGYEYADVKSSASGSGFRIVKTNSTEGCIGAFEALEFGVKTDEPAQCRIDFEHTESFDDMRFYIGGSNLYSYNHSEIVALPGADAFENASIILENGKTMNLYVRCKDGNGNENEAEYNIRFCVDDTPDVTAPQIQATSINNGQCVAEDETTANVEFYVNEPAECRWSFVDQDFDSMDYSMSCSSQLYNINALQLYTCKAELTGIVRDGTNFFVRCKDNVGKAEGDRNENKQSFEFSLKGSTALKLKNLQPNETIFGATNPAPVELYVETLFGCENGKAICYYSTTGQDKDYIMFYDTNNDDGINTQRLDLTEGKKKYYVKCVDSGGNVVEQSVSFNVEIDENAPVVARVYEEDGMLKVVTVRESECSYITDNNIGCDFSFEEGAVMPYANSTNHVAEWIEDKTYYIKCRDAFRDATADCSIVVRPTMNFL